MGMESYYVDIVPNDVKIVMNDDIRKYEGISNMNVSRFNNLLVNIPYSLRESKENFYIIDEAIQMQVIVKNQYVQTIILQGCLAWFEEGLEVCYRVVGFIKSNIMEVNVNTLGEYINFDNIDAFKRNVAELYKEKYEYFKSFLADYKIKILPSDFYNYRQKHLKSSNSIISKIKSLF